jgi:hypothetical protein
MTRDEIIELIRAQYDPEPHDWPRHRGWDDGAGEIADIICASQEALEARVALLKECHDASNDALRSAMQVAQREGTATNWAGHREQLRHALETHHAAAPSLPSAADIMTRFDAAIDAIKRA